MYNAWTVDNRRMKCIDERDEVILDMVHGISDLLHFDRGHRLEVKT